jgi:hypothetical protein
MFKIINKEPKIDAQNATCRKLDNIESSRMFTFHIQQGRRADLQRLLLSSHTCSLIVQRMIRRFHKHHHGKNTKHNKLVYELERTNCKQRIWFKGAEMALA